MKIMLLATTMQAMGYRKVLENQSSSSLEAIVSARSGPQIYSQEKAAVPGDKNLTVQRTVVLSADYDSCWEITSRGVKEFLEKRGYEKEYALARREFDVILESMVANAKKTILFVGSNRQSVSADLLNRLNHEKKGFFPETALANGDIETALANGDINFTRNHSTDWHWPRVENKSYVTGKEWLDSRDLDGFVRWEYERLAKAKNWDLLNRPLLADLPDHEPGSAWTNEDLHFYWPNGGDAEVKRRLVDYQLDVLDAHVVKQLITGPIDFYFIDDKREYLDYVTSKFNAKDPRLHGGKLHTQHYDWYDYMNQ